MKYQCIATWFLLGGITLAFGGWAVADDPILDPNEPPVRLKKKNKSAKDKEPDKKPEPSKDGDKDNKDAASKKDGSPSKPTLKKPDQAKEEQKKLVRRILNNMKEAEDRLAKKDPGSGTRSIQRDVLKDLDALIEQTKNQPPPQSSRRRSRQQNQSSKKSNPNSNQKPPQGFNRGGNPMQNPKGDPNNSNTKDGKTKKNGTGSAGNQSNGKGGAGGKNDKNKLADLFKDVWGHLPETLRQEMDAYARAKFVPKYDGLLRQYYRTISEQGRRKKGD